MTDKIIIAIREMQEKNRLRDSEIAEAIGFHVVSWRMIKIGKKRYGRRFLDSVKQAYPEIFLSSEAIK